MRKDPRGSWYLAGSYGSGKTHLLYAQYRKMVLAGKVKCHVRTTRDLVKELRRTEFDSEFNIYWQSAFLMNGRSPN